MCRFYFNKVKAWCYWLIKYVVTSCSFVVPYRNSSMSLKTVRQGKNECSIVMYHPCSVSEASYCVACVQHYALHLLDVFRSILKQDVLLTAWRLSVYLLAVYLLLTSCMFSPILFVYSLQCTAECGNFHLTVTITVFHGTVPCFIVFMPCDGNSHADYTHA